MAKDDQISSLLPNASVHLFAREEKTAKLGQILRDDWRFARVAVDQFQGGIDKAIATYQNTASPDLVIVETDNVDDGLTSRLNDLAGVCVSGTDALVIGPVNDVTLYRKLVDLGVKDYLVHPVEAGEIIPVIGRILVDRKGVSESKLLPVIGSKGGVGTSTIAQGMAQLLGDEFNEKTLYIEAASGWVSYPVTHGIDPVAELEDAVQAAEKGDQEGLSHLIHKVTDDFHILACGGGMMMEDSPGGIAIERLIDRLMVTYPVIVFDVSGGVRELISLATARGHAITLVSTPTLPALRNARSLIKDMIDMRDGGNGLPLQLIINKTGQSGVVEVSAKDIEDSLDHEINAELPFDGKTIQTPLADGQPYAATAKGKAFLNPIKPILADIADLPEDEKSEKESVISSFIKGFTR
jgi:pilus assembly protein CpaE